MAETKHEDMSTAALAPFKNTVPRGKKPTPEKFAPTAPKRQFTPPKRSK